jgi:CRISPR system Cascade subunit CasD
VHLSGPWKPRARTNVEREGSRTEGLRQQERPYRADADMTAVVDVQRGCLVAAEQILAALDQLAHPLFIGRSSCPPASRLAGRVFEATSLEAATLAVARDYSGEIYLPAEAATPAWGDLPLSIPGRRDWASFRHAGADLYVIRQRAPVSAAPA